jgi:hypothetical protein
VGAGVRLRKSWVMDGGGERVWRARALTISRRWVLAPPRPRSGHSAPWHLGSLRCRSIWRPFTHTRLEKLGTCPASQHVTSYCVYMSLAFGSDLIYGPWPTSESQKSTLLVQEEERCLHACSYLFCKSLDTLTDISTCVAITHTALKPSPPRQLRFTRPILHSHSTLPPTHS